jgi:hypothetical protein
VVGEPFSVTVSASAPFGLDALAWTATAEAGESGQRRDIGGAAYAVETWSDLAIDEAGVFEIRADAIDVRAREPLPGYPHRAASAVARLVVTEQADAFPR